MPIVDKKINIKKWLEEITKSKIEKSLVICG